MPGTPPTSPNFNLPRYTDADSATFSADINPIVDGIDSQAVKNTDTRLTDMRVPQDGSVATAKIADQAVTAQKIADHTVTAQQIAPETITSTEIQDGSVASSDLAPNAVTVGKVAAGAVTTGGLADGAVTVAKLDPLTQQLTMYTTGDLKLSLAPNPPPGWLACDGSAVARDTYAALFSIFGTTYGSGDGSSTFNLPDLRGRALVGAGQGQGLTNRPLGSKGGEESHSLVAGELANHTHTINDPKHVHGINDPGHAHGITDPGHSHGPPSGSTIYLLAGGGVTNVSVPSVSGGTLKNATATAPSDTGVGVQAHATGISLVAQGTGITVNGAGSGTPHNTMPPYCAVNYFVKT
jgi:microcystin-dependent protein